MAHASARRGGAAGDEGDDGFFDVGFDVGGGGFFVGAADFADDDDAVGVGVVVEHLQQLDEVQSFDRIAADADAGGLADAAAGALPDGFVSQRAGAADDADGFSDLDSLRECGCSRA